MTNEIYEVTLTNAAPVYVEAKSKPAAIKAAYATISARKLSGSEVRGLGDTPIISDATDPDTLPIDFDSGP